MQREITADTKICTYHSDFTGHTWQDGILGDNSLSVYTGCNVEDEAAMLADWFNTMPEGYWTEGEDSGYDDEYNPAPNNCSIITMTPREMARELIDAANREAELNAQQECSYDALLLPH